MSKVSYSTHVAMLGLGIGVASALSYQQGLELGRAEQTAMVSKLRSDLAAPRVVACGAVAGAEQYIRVSMTGGQCYGIKLQVAEKPDGPFRDVGEQ